jgi:hypothetical protein
MRRPLVIGFDRVTVKDSLVDLIKECLSSDRGWRSVWPWLTFDWRNNSTDRDLDLIWHTYTLEETKMNGKALYGLNVCKHVPGKPDEIYIVREYLKRVPRKSEHMSLHTYVPYVINHEFGHFLQARFKSTEYHVPRGHCSTGHVCRSHEDDIDVDTAESRPLQLAAVMSQQTKGSSPCVPNCWITEIDAQMLDEARFWASRS